MVARAPESREGRGAPAAPASNERASDAQTPWIWGRSVDLAVFGGSAAIALAFVTLSSLLADEGGGLPPWGWLLFVVAVDVAHVHTTLFRTYFDSAELRRRRALYIALPVACYAAGLALHLVSHLAFWRALAYLAVLHFIRQQIGWVAIYRARAGERSKLDRWLDDAVIYAATGWPLLHWHASPPRAFRWFIEGDFVALPGLAALVRPLGAVYVALLLAYVARSLTLAARSGFTRVNAGKHVVVATTAATWYVGIVATNTDFQFTVANVIVHGVPYMALLFAYARERAREAPRAFGSRIVALGFTAFFAVALALAFTEEVLWDRLVWHDRPFWFGGGETPLLGPLARAFIVPLLALPQATHYALDALLWRRRDTGAAQARALGFRAPPPREASADQGSVAVP